uniref:Chromatin-remodeling ATPase INO80 n=1 Tax=Timema shepardi TaxID=629360 RepID=A0A7R9B2P3_TIMSH|nr:unnamed protein product [Timema shepardi]
MDRAHRLGQTKQVTVYRLICKGSIEERILQRAREKSEIQRMVISGGNFKPDTLKPKEVVSLLLDDEEIEKKYRQKQAERRTQEEARADFYRERDRERKRKQFLGVVKGYQQSATLRDKSPEHSTFMLLTSTQKNIEDIYITCIFTAILYTLLQNEVKKARVEEGGEDTILSVDSAPPSPSHSEVSQGSGVPQDETSNEGLVVDVDSPGTPSQTTGEYIFCNTCSSRDISVNMTSNLSALVPTSSILRLVIVSFDINKIASLPPWKSSQEPPRSLRFGDDGVGNRPPPLLLTIPPLLHFIGTVDVTF